MHLKCSAWGQEVHNIYNRVVYTAVYCSCSQITLAEAPPEIENSFLICSLQIGNDLEWYSFNITETALLLIPGRACYIYKLICVACV